MNGKVTFPQKEKKKSVKEKRNRAKREAEEWGADEAQRGPHQPARQPVCEVLTRRRMGP